MSVDDPVHPPADTWVAAIHTSEADFDPIGTAVVIDANRLLTCAHVVRSADGTTRQPLWVSFPKAECPRRLVASVMVAYTPPVKDLAVLVLEEPVPAGVEAAPLRCPKPRSLVPKSWWAFGFPGRDPIGDSASGLVGEALAFGWIRLETKSSYLVRPGFSGGGLWSPDYKAVVGVVGQAHGNGDGRAITLHQADLCFPDQKLAMLAAWSAESADQAALQQWGWTLSRDPEGVRHWRPRARGVSIESERGYRFRGRTEALNEIVQWLDRPDPDRRVLVVTGSPGVGKSAALGRIVTTADAAIRALLPHDDNAVRATLGTVSCAVHAKAKTALEVAEEIARAASARLPAEASDLAPAIRDALGEHADRRFNVIIDALDEAATPALARAIIELVVLPLAETCSDVGVQIVVGTRRRDDGGDLLGRFGGALVELDLDDPRFFAQEDLAAYSLACLQLVGDERPGNPYADDTFAIPLAEGIAALSGQNFLVAGLIARSHGLYDKEAVAPGQLAFSATVDTALAAYLQRLGQVAGLSAARAFTALAFAEAPGLPVDLWRLAIQAVDRVRISGEDLIRLARSSAANFLIEEGEPAATDFGDGVAVYRLFHQALNDALMRAQADVMPRTEDERALTLAFSEHGRLSNWEGVPDYLLRSLPVHAKAARLIDNLLCDDAYLLHADLRRLMQVADDAHAVQGHRRAQLLRLTPQAIAAAPLDRVALFSVTEVLDDLGTNYRDSARQTSYRAQWSSVAPRKERAFLEGHHGTVLAVCAVTVADRQLLASGGLDRTVRIWDPQTCEQRAVLEGHQGWVAAVCAITVADRQLLASGSLDRTVRIWNPQTGKQHAILKGHQDRVETVCAVPVAGRELLASGGRDGTIRIWDPQTGKLLNILESHQGWVETICPVTVAGHKLLASGGKDGAVQIWNPENGELFDVLENREGWVEAICPIIVAGRQLLASGDFDGTIRIWDPQSGELQAVLKGHHGGIGMVCAVTVAGRQLLASGGRDGTVRVWDPQTGKQHAVLESLQGWVEAVCPIIATDRELLASGSVDGVVRIWDPQPRERTALGDRHSGAWAVCPVTVAGQELLASGGLDHTVRIWNPQTGEQHAILEGHKDRVRAVCTITVAGQELLASGGLDRTVRIWDPQTGKQHAILESNRGSVWDLCSITLANQQMLTISGVDGTIRIWDPQTIERHAVLRSHQGKVWAVCPVTVVGRQLLVSGGLDHTVRIWDPQTGEQHAILEGHRGAVGAVCPVTVAGRQLLASGSGDRTVRIWDPQTGKQHAILEGHRGAVGAVCPVTVAGRQLLASGSEDRTVRIWDPEEGIPLLSVPTHYMVMAVTQVAESLAIGLITGILTIKLGDAGPDAWL